MKGRNYWENEENVVTALKEVMDNNNCSRLPGVNELKKMGYTSLGAAVQRYHGGMGHMRRLFGEKPVVRVDSSDLKDLDYVVTALKEVMDENNCSRLPSVNELRKLGYSSLSRAIINYHGGMTHFRRMFGEDLWKGLGASDLKDLDYTVLQAFTIMEEHDFTELPGQTTLTQLGYWSLVKAITHYHGGMSKFRGTLRDYKGEEN